MIKCNCIKQDVCPHRQALAAAGQNIMPMTNEVAWRSFNETIRAFCGFRTAASNANGEKLDTDAFIPKVDPETEPDDPGPES